MSDRLRRGSFIRRADNIVWQVKLLKDGVLHLERAETGETDRLSLQQYEDGCFEGIIEPVRDPEAVVPEERQVLLKVPFRELPPKMVATALHKDFYLSAFQDPRAFCAKHFLGQDFGKWLMRPNKGRAFITPFSRLVHEAFLRERLPEVQASFERALELEQQRIGKLLPEQKRQLPVKLLKAPRPSTYISWISEWENSACQDKRLLADRFSDRGPDKRTMSPLLEEWLNETIDEVWLQPMKRKKVTVFKRLSSRVRKWNRENPERQIKMIGQRHVSRYISEEINQETVVRRREGDEAADRRFKQVGEAPETEHILEVVEVDHTRADVDVLDDLTLRKLGRPWVTTAFDRHSRMVVGLHVHFDGPSLGAVMQCLRNTMMPKHFLRELCPDVDYDYPAAGVPVAFFFDRGSDFDTDHVRDIGLTFDIRVDYAPVECPETKGKTERWHRTMAEEVAHPLPGATPPADENGYRRDKDGRAYITFSGFVRRLWFWIVMVYARSHHRGLGDTPLKVWNQSAAQRLPRPLRKKEDLDVLLQRVELLTPSNQGVRWKHLRWNGQPIRDIMGHPGFRRGNRVKIRIDENDLARAWVIDPVTGVPHLLDPVRESMRGLTLYRHRMALLWADENLDGARDDESLLAAQDAMLAEEEALLEANVGSRTRSQAALARHRGVGASAPAGSDTGSVEAPGEPGHSEVSTEALSTTATADQADETKARTPRTRRPVRDLRKDA